MSTKGGVGRVVQVLVYPVKSMAGCPVDGARLGRDGFLADRRFAFVISGQPGKVLTARQFSRMILYKARLIDPTTIDSYSPVRVMTPGGKDLPVDSPELAAEITCESGLPVELKELERGAFESADVSLIGRATIEAVCCMAGMPVDARRFRPNIVTETADALPFTEDSWVGSVLQFGECETSARVRIQAQTTRCLIPGLDPDSAEQSGTLLKHMAQVRKNLVGVYAGVVRTGVVKVGSEVVVVE